MTTQRRVSGIYIPDGVEVPDTAPEKTWKCKVGHLRKGRQPFQLQFLVDGEPVMMTNPLCPVCFRTWLENRFEAKEVKDASDRPNVRFRPGGHRTR